MIIQEEKGKIRMKRLALDFDNNCLCIMMEGQHGTEIISGIKREDFKSFIPEKYNDKSSFTWDFETENISVNRPYKAKNNFMTEECFVPEIVESMPGIGKRFNEFIKILDLEPVNLAEEIKKDMPELATLLGL